MVAKITAETLGATMGYVESELPDDTLANIWRGGGRESLRDTKEVKGKALDHRQVDRFHN